MKISWREQPSHGKCALCRAPMIERVAKFGQNRGGTFLGCARWPECSHTISTDSDDCADPWGDNDDGGTGSRAAFPYRDDWGW